MTKGFILRRNVTQTRVLLCRQTLHYRHPPSPWLAFSGHWENPLQIERCHTVRWIKIETTSGLNSGIFYLIIKYFSASLYRLCGSTVMIWAADDETLCHTGRLKSAVREHQTVCWANWLITSWWRRCYNYSSIMCLYPMVKCVGFLWSVEPALGIHSGGAAQFWGRFFH